MMDRVRTGHESIVVVRISFLLALAACGSGPVAPVDGGGTDSGNKPDSTIGFPDAGSDVVDAAPGCTPGVCPSTPPADNTACSGDLVCEYGTAANPDCNVMATCMSNAWHVVSFDGGCGTSSACPATWAEATSADAGVTCGPSNSRCDYNEGVCGCVGGSWGCAAPTDPSCPKERPRYGTACSSGSPTCSYGADCTALAGFDVECACGRWVVPPPPGCPPPGPGP